MSMSAASDGRVQTPIHADVVDVPPAAREQSGILAAADGGADNTFR